MAAPTQYWVDPSINANSGTGTSGDPWGDLQYALDQTTRDTANGDQFNIKAGTSEKPGAALTLTSYGTPTLEEPLILRGYGTTAEDGTIAEIDYEAGNVNPFSITVPYLMLLDLKIGNFGTGTLVGGTDFFAYNCEIYGSTSTNGIDASANGTLLGCYIHGFTGAIGVDVGTGGYIKNCYFEDCGTTISVKLTSTRSVLSDCIIKINSTTCDGLLIYDTCRICNCVVYNAAAGTGTGIDASGRGTAATVVNNIIEGFNGSGGLGILTSSSGGPGLYLGNRAYNCSTGFTFSGDEIMEDDNLVPGSSLFSNAAAGDFSVTAAAKAAGYFTTFNGLGTTLTYVDTGAAQRQEVAGVGGGSGGRYGF